MPIQYELKMRLGADVLTIKTDEDKMLFKKVGFFNSLPNTCPRCGSPVRISHRSYDKYDYYELLCTGQKDQNKEFHKAKVGEHLNEEGFFFRHDQKWLTMNELKNGHEHYSKDGRDNSNDESLGSQGGRVYDEPKSSRSGRGGTNTQSNRDRRSKTENSDQRQVQPKAPPDHAELDDDLPF